MARHHVYIKAESEKLLKDIFEYLKHSGDIPTNAEHISEYRSQCIQFAIAVCIASIKDSTHER